MLSMYPVKFDSLDLKEKFKITVLITRAKTKMTFDVLSNNLQKGCHCFQVELHWLSAQAHVAVMSRKFPFNSVGLFSFMQAT